MSAQGQAEHEFQQEYEKAMERSRRCRMAPSGDVRFYRPTWRPDAHEWTLVAFEVAALSMRRGAVWRDGGPGEWLERMRVR